MKITADEPDDQNNYLITFPYRHYLITTSHNTMVGILMKVNLYQPTTNQSD